MWCPTLDDTARAVLALLPRGRAWANHEGGPEPYRIAPFDPAAFDPADFDTDARAGTVLYRFWEAYAKVLQFFVDRMCALRLEMFCATVSETRDNWLAEYGLPDACDPFPDLCMKVAAIGGTRCEYYASVAARGGWSITCLDEFATCAAQPGARFKAGCAQPGRRAKATLQINVDLGSSPAYSAGPRRPPKAGRLKAGLSLSCGPDISALECLLARVVHAEILIIYEAH